MAVSLILWIFMTVRHLEEEFEGGVVWIKK